MYAPIEATILILPPRVCVHGNAELRIFLIQETHLRPSHNLNIANYTCHRISDGPQIPPSSDENLFTIDTEHFIQTASNCILFGDFNATHNAWNCKNNTTRGRHLFNFANRLNLNIAFPSTPTRLGHNSANTIDIALIKNFYYPFTINSIDDLSSDHNPVFLNFNFKLAEEPPNPRAVSTDWNAFKTNLNKNLSLFDFRHNSINNTNDLEQKTTEFTEAVIDTHSHASRPIETDRRNFTPHNINQLLKIKNYFRKRYHQTLNPIFKSHYNRTQSDLKKELKKYNDIICIENKVLLYTAIMRPILAFASPVWGYAAKTNINILDTLQNSLIRMIVKATRYMRNDDIPAQVLRSKFYMDDTLCGAETLEEAKELQRQLIAILKSQAWNCIKFVKIILNFRPTAHA
ncbi:RNA-directed DNA polymerase from mobile element jockey [Trichonephila clavipes]|nr:RNA-directed DNA polymerase from mobile element jockey [Trichonephila clavipes]